MAEIESKANAAREYITFRIGSQYYCIDIMSVREIRGWTPATALPRAPGFVRGVINLRGAVLPIIDLADRLGFAADRADAAPRHHRRADRQAGGGPAGRRRLRHHRPGRRQGAADAGRRLGGGARVRARRDGDGGSHDQPHRARKRHADPLARGRMTTSARTAAARERAPASRRVHAEPRRLPPHLRDDLRGRRDQADGRQGGAGLCASRQASAGAEDAGVSRLLRSGGEPGRGRRASGDADLADDQRHQVLSRAASLRTHENADRGAVRAKRRHAGGCDSGRPPARRVRSPIPSPSRCSPHGPRRPSTT